jgi:S-adenosylmethionine:diacylglycerol 3-amino-3-carboxypropyl transferase
MQDIMTDALAILIACLAITALASALVIFRPSARRRRRRRRHSTQPRIDLFEPVHAEIPAEPDA